MTTFESELRKLFDHNVVFDDTRFVGRVCYGKINDSLRVRAEFITLDTANKYEALKVTLINRTEGAIDSVIIRFRELLGKKQVNSPYLKDGVYPYLWIYQGKLEWYAYKLTPADSEILTNAVENYLEVFQESIQEMTKQAEQQM